MTLINIYAPNQEAPKYIKQLLTELKGETDQKTIVVGDPNTPLSDMDRSYKHKINKEITSLNDTLDQLDIMTFTEPSIPKRLLIHSSLVHMEHSQGLTIYWDTEIASTNIRGLKSYQPYSLMIMLRK